MAEDRQGRKNPLNLGTVLVIVSLLLVGSGVVAWNLVWRIPPEYRLFSGLLTISLYFVAGGLVSLIFVIPAAGTDYEINTEFYSVRAAYFCVFGGLAMAVAVTVGMILGGLHVFGQR
jgi:hypothetical protein